MAGENIDFSFKVSRWWRDDSNGRWSSLGLDIPPEDAPAYPDLTILLMFAPPKNIW